MNIEQLDDHSWKIIDELARFHIEINISNFSMSLARQLLTELVEETGISEHHLKKVIYERVELLRLGASYLEGYKKLLETAEFEEGTNAFTNIKLIRSLYNQNDYFADKNNYSDGSSGTERLIMSIRQVKTSFEDSRLITPEFLKKLAEHLLLRIETANRILEEQASCERQLSKLQSSVAKGYFLDYQFNSINSFIKNIQDDYTQDNFEIILFSRHVDGSLNPWSNIDLAVISDKFLNLPKSERAKKLRNFIPEDNPWFSVVGIARSEFENGEATPLLLKIRQGRKICRFDNPTKF